MDLSLTGKHAVVTGSTKGIGFAVALGLARLGASVTLNGRSAASLAEGMTRLLEAVPEARVDGVAADLSQAAGAAELFRAVPSADILVNNVGMFSLQDFFSTGDEDWQRYFDANIMGFVRPTRHYLPGMIEAGWGRVVCVASDAAIAPPDDMLAYAVSKAAGIVLARGTAQLAKRSGVTVNSVLPAATLSDGVREVLAAAPDFAGMSLEEAAQGFMDAAKSGSLTGRIAQPEEIANLIVFLCSPAASFITGSALRVDGGLTQSIL